MLRVLFLGTPAFAVLPLEALSRDERYELVGVVTQPDRATGRARTPEPPPVKQAAERLGLPVFQPETLRDQVVVDQLAALHADVGVVAAYGEILRPAVLSLPPLGYLNIHPSLLPRHRGPAPVVGAILAGDDQTGVTIMRLDQKMDSGPILAQQTVPLGPEARAGELTTALFELGSDMLCAALAPYAAGTLQPTPQDDSAATYTKLLRKSDGAIDWNASAVQIERMTRAYDPWPGAWTTWRAQPLKIIAAHAHAHEVGAAPGALLDRSDGLWVATGDGVLELIAVQPSGKRALAAAEWRRGLRAIAGAQFGM
ncbi:MAG TPA: methionyl-tRNA formyltransferase [Roseiflexaceae bacterium]|nr:methionyl-tRNA formyltransferase [Roseiflexaceae bacterium]